MTTKSTRLLLVCTGNTCRSQMANAMAAQWAQRNCKAIELASRGIRATDGAETTADVRAVLAECGIAWKGTSQQLRTQDLRWADHVWVMTHEHLQFAARLAHWVDSAERPIIQLLHGEQEIIDPLGLGVQAYQALYDDLTKLLPIRLAALVVP